MDEHIQIEQQLISILLSDKQQVKAFEQSKVSNSYFDEQHQLILSGIDYATVNGVQLTRQTFKEFLSEFKKLSPQETASQITLYNKCAFQAAKADDQPILLEKIHKAYVRRRTSTYLANYRDERDKLGDIGANRALIDKLAKLEADAAGASAEFIQINNQKIKFLEDLYHRRNNPESRLTCNIEEIDETMNVGFKAGHLTLFCADVGAYKCLSSKELCQIQDGSYEISENIFHRFENGEKISLLSIDDSGKIYLQPILGVQSNGFKDVFRITTRSGFSVEVTGNHPLLKFNGWSRADEISIRDKIAIARKGTFGISEVSDDLAIWVGCMLTDGCSRKMQQFSNIDPFIIDRYEIATNNLGGSLRLRPYNDCDHRGNGLKHIMSEFGFDNTLSINKSIHPEIYRWNRESTIKLLQAMYGCDGSFSYVVTKRSQKHEVAYHTSSKQLAIDVRNLLLKFGLVGRIFTFMSGYTREDGTKHRREAYRVYLSDAKQVAKFIREIGFLGKKQAEAEACLVQIDITSQKENPNIDLIPSDVWNIVEKKFTNGKTNHGCRRFLKGESANRSNCPPIWARRTSGVSRCKLRKIAEYLDNDKELLQICDSDIYWDEVISVKNIGKDQTYDIAMPTHHNFVANNIITHNTTIMVNVAINIFKYKNENVLYVPLEMPADEILMKIVSRETGVPLGLLEHADKLSEEQIKRVGEEMEKWNSLQNRFSIMEIKGRPKLSVIRREIEKRMSFFKPRIVFIDYADNVIPESKGHRSDLEMNDILEDMRQMGKALEFSVVSAAQLGRDGLKRLQEFQGNIDKMGLGSTDVKGGQVMTANSDNVYGQIRNPANPNGELIFTCIGYETATYEIIQVSGKSVEFLLHPKSYLLGEVDISSKKYSFVFKDKDYSVLDYEIMGGNLLLLVFRYQLSRYE
ncbi:MAG: DnaB-like helicase C-terminal domain-containing protein, partial [bacterium]